MKSKHRIFFHDFGAYPFLFSLTRELSNHHDTVIHAYVELLSVSRNGTEAGKIRSSNYSLLPVEMDGDYQTVKYSFSKRFKLERTYGSKLAAKILEVRPSIVISSNAPTHIQSLIQKAARQVGAKFVFWVQDLYSEAVGAILKKKLHFVGNGVGYFFRKWERSLLLKSDRIVVISDTFKGPLEEMGCSADLVTTVENWADLNSYPVLPQENEWSINHGLAGKFCFLYSGTMGLKHNPEFLLELAKKFQDDPRVKVVVVAEGPGADFLKERSGLLGLERTLITLPFQSAEVVAEVLATASVLIATLHSEAGHYCVPSKVLSYLCAGRPLLLALPLSNPAARITRDSGAGFCCEPSDMEGFLKNAATLLSSEGSTFGENSRRYAEKHFQIGKIADNVNQILS
ncbi:MAG: glycosyltransferase family 4 protein [Verrucomicrobiota bacterium]